MATNRTAFILFLSLILTIFVNCGQARKGERIVSRGFIMFDNPRHWYFIPTESLDLDSCFKNFHSGNFGKGLQFNPSRIPNVSYLSLTFDTLNLTALDYRSLKLTPVEMAFWLGPDYLKLYRSSDTDPKWNFNFQASLEDREIEFVYNIFPIQIDSVQPMFCLKTKEPVIQGCECIEDEQDPEGYLSKICIHIKSRDPYSDLPCKYKIKRIGNDTLEGKQVIKVELNCCYLGDIAYFDIETRELLTISFGAQ